MAFFRDHPGRHLPNLFPDESSDESDNEGQATEVHVIPLEENPIFMFLAIQGPLVDGDYPGCCRLAMEWMSELPTEHPGGLCNKDNEPYSYVNYYGPDGWLIENVCEAVGEYKDMINDAGVWDWCTKTSVPHKVIRIEVLGLKTYYDDDQFYQTEVEAMIANALKYKFGGEVEVTHVANPEDAYWLWDFILDTIEDFNHVRDPKVHPFNWEMVEDIANSGLLREAVRGHQDPSVGM